MRNPLRQGLIWLAMLPAGLMLLGFTVVLVGLWLDRGGNMWVVVGIVAIIGTAGLGMALFSPVMAAEYLVVAHGRAKLAAGKDVIARWHVDAADWERFRAFDAGRALAGVRGEVRFAGSSSPRGAEIVVGRKSALIDGSYHKLRPSVWSKLERVDWLADPSGPSVLEFVFVPGRGSPGAVRLPVPGHAEADARRVYQHFAAPTR